MSRIKGEKFVVEKTESSQDRISPDAVRELLTPEQIMKVTKTINIVTLKSTRIDGTKPKFKMPNLENMTPSGLADLLGEVREQIKDLEKLEGIYKEALKARIDQPDDLDKMAG